MKCKLSCKPEKCPRNLTDCFNCWDFKHLYNVELDKSTCNCLCLQEYSTEIQEEFLEACKTMKKLGVTEIKISNQTYEKLQEERKQNLYIDFDGVEITHCMGIKIEVEV